MTTSTVVQGFDAYDISDPVDILKNLEKFDDDVSGTEKWLDRKAHLTSLKTMAKVRISRLVGCVIPYNHVRHGKLASARCIHQLQYHGQGAHALRGRVFHSLNSPCDPKMWYLR